MKPLVFLLLSCALPVGAAEIAASAPQAHWWSGLDALKTSASALKGLGENMADGPEIVASQLADFGKPLESLELIQAAAHVEFGCRRDHPLEEN